MPVPTAPEPNVRWSFEYDIFDDAYHFLKCGSYVAKIDIFNFKISIYSGGKWTVFNSNTFSIPKMKAMGAKLLLQAMKQKPAASAEETKEVLKAFEYYQERADLFDAKNA